MNLPSAVTYKSNIDFFKKLDLQPDFDLFNYR